MTKKTKLILVTNLASKTNPPLWYIYNLLKDKYDIIISGYDKYDVFDSRIKYYQHNTWHQRFIRFIYQRAVFKVYLWILNFIIKKEKITREIIDERIKLFFYRKYFKSKFKKVDFVINIDAEACLVSSDFIKKYKTPSCYFVYELIADQKLDTIKPLKEHFKSTESIAVHQSEFYLTNIETAFYLNNKYNATTDCLPFTICAPKTFDKLFLNEPLKFYYHGYFFNNRGIEQTILAFRKTKKAKLYFRGMGPLKDEMERLIVENHLDDRVFFLDPVPTEDLPAVGVEYDLGLTLVRMNTMNHRYASGFKTFDNISSGLALILPASEPLKTVIAKYQLGISYEDATEENLTKVFLYCENNPQQVLQWKENSRKAYELEYNPEMQKQKLIEKIETILN